jgi:hypothetical protein
MGDMPSMKEILESLSPLRKLMSKPHIAEEIKSVRLPVFLFSIAKIGEQNTCKSVMSLVLDVRVFVNKDSR